MTLHVYCCHTIISYLSVYLFCELKPVIYLCINAVWTNTIPPSPHKKPNLSFTLVCCELHRTHDRNIALNAYNFSIIQHIILKVSSNEVQYAGCIASRPTLPPTLGQMESSYSQWDKWVRFPRIEEASGNVWYSGISLTYIVYNLHTIGLYSNYECFWGFMHLLVKNCIWEIVKLSM